MASSLNLGLLVGLLAACASLAFDSQRNSGRERTPVDGFEVVHVYPHDRLAFTQGLEYRDGFLYEGTGLNARSSVRKVRLDDGRILEQAPVEPKYFGEGITVFGDRIFELTWQHQLGFVYDRRGIHLQKTFQYTGEGWGLANDGKRIFMSDGTEQLRYLDPETLRESRRITVRDGNEPVTDLNELEWVRGEIYANVWHTDRIARISPVDGRVLGWIDLTGLLSDSDQTQPVDVLNGIAYDAAGDRLFVTGKLWPKLFEIKLVARKTSN